MRNAPEKGMNGEYVWTRLQGSPLWLKAEAAYEESGLDYHNMTGHVRSMYAWAKALGLPYSRRLDENILAHDVVMGLGPGANERASRAWLMANSDSDDPEWGDPILNTIEHWPREDESGIAMLDLASFMSPKVSRENTELLRLEAMRVKGERFSHEGWLAGSVGYLETLADRIRHDLTALDGCDKGFWPEILEGVVVTAACMPPAYGGAEPSVTLCAALRATGPAPETKAMGLIGPWLGERPDMAFANALDSGLVFRDGSGRLHAEDEPEKDKGWEGPF